MDARPAGERVRAGGAPSTAYQSGARHIDCLAGGRERLENKTVVRSCRSVCTKNTSGKTHKRGWWARWLRWTEGVRVRRHFFEAWAGMRRNEFRDLCTHASAHVSVFARRRFHHMLRVVEGLIVVMVCS